MLHLYDDMICTDNCKTQLYASNPSDTFLCPDGVGPRGELHPHFASPP